jgi:hypothetical protein
VRQPDHPTASGADPLIGGRLFRLGRCRISRGTALDEAERPYSCVR